MISESLMLTVAGMGSVLLFLLFLVTLMYASASVFAYIGPKDEAVSDEDEAVVAALASVVINK